MRNLVRFAIALGAITFASNASAQAATAPACSDWTVAVFLEAEGGLYSFLASDMREMTNIRGWKPVTPTGPCINLVVQFSRGTVERRVRDWSKEPSDVFMPDADFDAFVTDRYWPPVRRIVDKDVYKRLWDDDALSSFVRETVREFPARNVALIIGSHGEAARASSPVGRVAEDGTRSLGSPTNFLSNRKFGGELRKIFDGLGGSELRVIGLDACQLASVEAEYEIGIVAKERDKTVHVVASEDNQGGPGWFYQDLLPRLLSARDGKSFADAIIAHAPVAWDKWSDEQRYFGTLSEIDARGTVDVGKSLDALGAALRTQAEELGEGPKVLKATNEARCSCRRFPGAESKSSRLVDVACFAEAVGREKVAFEPSVRAAATALSSAIKQTVKNVGRCPSTSSRMCGGGLSVFLPPKNQGLSGYQMNVEDPPRFVRDVTDGEWAKWVRFWSERAPSEC